jgi:hypothetical protein
MSLEGINWLAVIVSAVAYFILGALWYSPLLFAKPFIRYRFGEAGMPKNSESGQPLEYLFTFLIELVAAVVLAIFVKMAGAVTLLDGVAVGLVAAVGFAASTSFVYTIFSGPHKMLWVINTGYVLVAFAIMGAILALWV